MLRRDTPRNTIDARGEQFACHVFFLLSSPLLSGPLDTVVEVAQLEQSPHRTLRTDALLLLRMLWVLAARTKELTVKLVFVIGGAPTAIALAHPHVVFGIRNLHFSSSLHSFLTSALTTSRQI